MLLALSALLIQAGGRESARDRYLYAGWDDIR
jgi:hypothetical protein